VCVCDVHEENHVKAPAIQAFKMMSQNRISGMAVVDDEGVLIGNISASDIKLFLEFPRAKVMQLPVQVEKRGENKRVYVSGRDRRKRF